MSYIRFIVLLFFIACMISICNGYKEVLASSNACAYAKTYTATIFNAPQDGTIVGVKAVINKNQSESMSCDTSRSLPSNWGCYKDAGTYYRKLFMVEIMKVTN